MEADTFRKKGLTNPIAIIPNGIELEDFPLKEVSKSGTIKKILFLSRIHYKKGLEVLIEAWSQLPSSLTKDWKIDMIGNGERDYIDELNSMISKKELTESIHIKSPVYGLEKIKAYQDADLFILPTFSENFGIVVVEALSCGTPVITTKGAPWEELNKQDCGWWIDTGVEPLKTVLKDVLLLSSEDLLKKGKLGRNLVEKKYSMQAVAQQMHSLYKWILDKTSPKPDFVRLN
jgi:glycosyltransferase involved in cell wall biosynthesis